MIHQQRMGHPLTRQSESSLARVVFLQLAVCVIVGSGSPCDASTEPSFSRDAPGEGWGSFRSLLEENGISVELVYTVDVLSNVLGGVKRETEVLGNVDVVAGLDLEPLFGWPGGRMLFYGIHNHGGSISSAVGDLQGVSNIEAPGGFKLFEAWFEQEFSNGGGSLKMGLYDVNSEFDVIDSAQLFLQSSHGIGGEFGLSGKNGPSIFSVTSLGARLLVRPSESLYIQGAVLDGVPGDPGDPRGIQIDLDHDDGVLLLAEVGHVVGGGRADDEDGEDGTAASGSGTPGYGKIACGIWKYTGDFDDTSPGNGGLTPSTSQGGPGVYFLAEKDVLRGAGDSDRGFSLFGRAGFASDKASPVDRYFGGGFVCRGLVPGRCEDRVGVAVAVAHLGNRVRRVSPGEPRPEEWEVALELTYQASINSWLSVQPDLQYVVHPGGDPKLEDAVVVGVRIEVAF